MSKAFLEAGKIVALHGVRGEMRLKPWSDDAAFLKGFKTVYLDAQGEQPVRLLSARAHGNVTLIRLEGIDSAEKAETLRNMVLFIKKSDISLPQGHYFIDDIIGLQAVDAETLDPLGVVSEVEQYPANDVWHIRTDAGVVLIPHIPDVVKKVALDEGKVYIFKMKGLFEDAH